MKPTQIGINSTRLHVNSDKGMCAEDAPGDVLYAAVNSDADQYQEDESEHTGNQAVQ